MRVLLSFLDVKYIDMIAYKCDYLVKIILNSCIMSDFSFEKIDYLFTVLSICSKVFMGGVFYMNDSRTKYCGEIIPFDSVICTTCGRQVEEIKNETRESIVINNNNNNNATAVVSGLGTPKNKWIALFLCIFTICGHKFYEGKPGMGFIYIFTLGLFFIGWIVDIITLLGKPTTYYV